MENSLLTKFWEDHVDHTYETFKRFIISKSLTIVFSLMINMFFIDDLWKGLANLTIAIISLSVLTSFTFYVKNQSISAKSAYAILYSEFMLYVLLYLGKFKYKEYETVCQMLSITIVCFFDISFISRFWVVNLIFIKQVLVWHHLDYLLGRIDLTNDIYPHLIALLWIVLFNNIIIYKFGNDFSGYINNIEKAKAERRLEVIINSFSDGIIIINQNLKIVYSNHNTEILLDCPSGEIKNVLRNVRYCDGKKYSNFQTSSDLFEDLKLMFDLENDSTMMLGISVCNGTKIEWKAKKIMWEDDSALSLVLRNANNIIELEQSISDNKLKNVLLRSVSHELRTPINAISFLTEDLLQESDLSAENCEKLKIISVSAKFLLSLVNDLLDYSKMLAGVFSINRSQLNLSTILNDVLELIKIQAERRKISLILRLDPNLPKIIHSDPLRLQQVLLNLLSNALKFTLKGSIEIICSLSSQNSIKITVKDTGIGIKNSQLKLLFTEFNTENDTVLNPQGCGLGLNISNKIIKEIGKNPMTVISNYGQGSEFTFEVIINDYPEDSDVFVEDPSYNDTNEDAAYDSSWLQTIEIKKIPQVLIVDDNDFNRRIIVTLLTKYNITSAEASNGQEALDLLITYKNHNNQNFKVILMDGEMPVLDGWETTIRINEFYYDRGNEFKPVIIGYTAYTADEDIERFYECGMKECLTKPCGVDKMVLTIMKYL